MNSTQKANRTFEKKTKLVFLYVFATLNFHDILNSFLLSCYIKPSSSPSKLITKFKSFIFLIDVFSNFFYE